MMATIWKLTPQKMTMRNNMRWVLGETRSVSGKGSLCSGGWLHAYTHPGLAVLLPYSLGLNP